MRFKFHMVVIVFLASVSVACVPNEWSVEAGEMDRAEVEEEPEIFVFGVELAKVKDKTIRNQIASHHFLRDAFIQDKDMREQLQKAETAMEAEVGLAKYWNAENAEYLEAMGSFEEAERVREQQEAMKKYDPDGVLAD
ncbi:hypothetical protein P4475_03700 [Halalkalibacterium halodurans]|uniref:hypothetical protein n=1 Tax=Halalkalibacterium halodurans TaxID=86665 RepID=UPI001067E3FE|nr:hypothetical protein [Halalkalibacterium halodurans]MED3645918.1 hypothetical protein [Halalkalibacterium halodurans]TES58141.1 hypothetical protein E2L07_00140 [Halalkalibacterium halodurans]